MAAIDDRAQTAESDLERGRALTALYVVADK